MCGYSKSMSLILPGTYSVGVPQISSLSQEEQRAIRQLSGTASTQTLTFFRLYHQGTMLNMEGKEAKETRRFLQISLDFYVICNRGNRFLGMQISIIWVVFAVKTVTLLWRPANVQDITRECHSSTVICCFILIYLR